MISVDIGPLFLKSYSAPKRSGEGPKSLDEVDPELIETYNKLGIPLEEQKALAGVAVDTVFDSVSVATTSSMTGWSFTSAPTSKWIGRSR